jgi:hypothetical protein
MYNKDEIKESLTIEQIYELVAEMGGEPQMKENYFVSRTICHNPAGQGSYKLYYYENTKLFKCYTDCGDYFDIFELVRKQMSIKNNSEWGLPKSISFVAKYFGFSAEEFNSEDENLQLQDWKILSNYEKILEQKEEQIVQLKFFDDKILKFLPRPRILPWEEEGIAQEVMEHRGICYDPKNEGIVIPHYDIDSNLIGIRERTLIKENEKFGKYLPAKLNNQIYNHPLSFNLYNLNNSKENIKAIKKVIVFESEKSCLKYASFFGEDNDISVAVCGSSLISYQVKLLLSLNVEEIIIAFDRQFQELGDDEWKRWTKKLTDIHTKYGSYVQISYMFDKKNLLDYKMSPIDKDRDTFLTLFKERVYI